MSDLFGSQRQRLERLGQVHLLRFADELSPPVRRAFLTQIAGADIELVLRLYDKLVAGGKATPAVPVAAELEPAAYTPLPPGAPEALRHSEAWAAGERLLRAGQVACLMVAGGQGSRLGFAGPKGAFPLGPVTGRSLFEMQAHKVLAACRRYGCRLPLYVMVSDTNAAATQALFEEHGWFGLRQDDVVFFCQQSLPAVDAAGRVILEEKGRLSMSPNGHGGVIAALHVSGALADMKGRGIAYVSYFQVDNPLVRAVDPYFLGLHALSEAEMSLKVLEKRQPFEKVGNVLRQAGRLRVIEYSDFPADIAALRETDGSLRFRLGGIAIHAFRVEFLERLATFSLPYHVAHKKIAYVDAQGAVVEPGSENGYKFETFIFDVLGAAESSLVVETAREFEFSPVKNATGLSSPETSRRDLCRWYRRILRAAGVDLPDEATPVEISVLCGMDAVELKAALAAGCRPRTLAGGIVVRP